jgi:hypothetical protein
MMRKITGIVVAGLLLATLIPVGTSCIQGVDQQQRMDYNSHLIGFGFYRVNIYSSSISAFVIYGKQNGNVLILHHVTIHFVDATIVNPLNPIIINIYYDPWV